ncbi:MAG: SDR family NAD(P)-dependent oxidoreductase, partial [Gammaproteobacteria bacterium]|nr:SDR family NAD(P)-dependent oxidoreductase [Gammaproteobacteria bacterium]
MAYDAFDLSGKVAVVTGGNGGIGLGFARAVAAAGADVSIWGTNPDKNAAAEKELKEINPSASATICDVSNESAVEEAMAGVIARYGRVDACFPNAGIGTQNQKPFFEHSNEDWFSVIDVNLHGVFYTLRAATRQMVEQGEGGTLVLTASGTAIQGAAKGQAYAATTRPRPWWFGARFRDGTSPSPTVARLASCTIIGNGTGQIGSGPCVNSRRDGTSPSPSVRE